MAEWFDYQTVVLVVIFAAGFGLVWWVLSLRDGPRPGDAMGSDWYEVLGIRSDASWEEIEGAYLAKVERYSGERLNDLGPDFARMAERKRAEIDWALSKARHLRRPS